MSDTCPTVKIKTNSGFALLNEADFDPAIHELWVDTKSIDTGSAVHVTVNVGDTYTLNGVEHTISASTKDPLDHDKDGKPGGSTAPEQTDDLTDVRAQYAELFGKRPFMGWDAKTLTAKIEEKLAE